jgi:hypothetical protein
MWNILSTVPSSLFSTLAFTAQRNTIVKNKQENSVSGPQRPSEIFKWSGDKESSGATALEASRNVIDWRKGFVVTMLIC